MSKKTLIQLSLLVLIFTLPSIFYFKYYYLNKEDAKKVNQSLKSKESSNINQSNLIKDLQYYSKDLRGNVYLLKAETGSPDEKDPDLIKLQNVSAKVNFDTKNEIFITSDNAIYNNISYDTKFIGNVIITNGEHKVNCDFMDAKISNNVAILSGKVTYDNNFTKLNADKIEYDLLKRTSKISMFNKDGKVKITYKK